MVLYSGVGALFVASVASAEGGGQRPEEIAAIALCFAAACLHAALFVKLALYVRMRLQQKK